MCKNSSCVVHETRLYYPETRTTLRQLIKQFSIRRRAFDPVSISSFPHGGLAQMRFAPFIHESK